MTWSEHAWLEDKNNPVPFSLGLGRLRAAPTCRAPQRKAAPPGKIFSIFTMGCTLDSIPPEMLMPGEGPEHGVTALPQTLSSQEEQGIPSSKSALTSSRLWAVSSLNLQT